jgi:L-lysine 6-transaminase
MWAHQHFNFEPDMVAFGKKTQVCGFLCGSRIDDIEDNVFHVASRLNSTWGGNLMDMFRFKVYLDIIEEERLVENAARVGEALLGGLKRLGDEFPELVSNVRGRGLMCAFDLPTKQMRDLLRAELYSRAIVLLGSGMRSVRFRPPLTMSEREVAEGLDGFREALKSLSGRPIAQPVA